MVQLPSRGYCTSSALRKALPDEENRVSETRFDAVVDRIDDRDAGASSSSHHFTRRWPMKLAASTPVRR